MTVVNVTPPVITGTAEVGETLHADDGAWTFDLDYLTYGFQWKRCDAAGLNCSAVSGKVAPSYVLTTSDLGFTMRVDVDATEHSGDSTSPTPPQPTITYVDHVAIGLNIGNDPQAVWEDYDISYTGDSSIIMGPIPGNGVTTLRRFKITHVGEGPGYPGYAVHGLYCKRPNTQIQDFDITNPNGDGMTLRRKGIVVDRFRINSGTDFVMSYFEEESTGGLVTVKNGTGIAGSGYFMWTGSNPDAYVGNMHQEFLFQNCHATIGGSNPKWIGIDLGELAYDGPGVTLQGCTINGSPVNSGHIQNFPIISIS